MARVAMNTPGDGSSRAPEARLGVALLRAALARGRTEVEALRSKAMGIVIAKVVNYSRAARKLRVVSKGLQAACEAASVGCHRIGALRHGSCVTVFRPRGTVPPARNLRGAARFF